MDIVAPLVDGRMWAREASQPHAPLIWVAAGGFTDEFRNAARRDRQEVYLWTLEDLYG